MIVVFSFITLALFADPLNSPAFLVFQLVVRSWRKTCLFLLGCPLCLSLLLSPWLSPVSYFSFIDVQLKNDTWTLPAGIDDLSFMMMTMTMMMTYAPATGLPPPPARGALSENFFTLICRIAENAFMIAASRYVFAYLFNFLMTKMPSQILIAK